MTSSTASAEAQAGMQSSPPVQDKASGMDGSVPDCGKDNDLSAADIRGLLSRSKKGAVVQSASNCAIVLREDPVLKEHVFKDELSERICIKGDVPWKRDDSMYFTDTDLGNIIARLEKVYGLTNDKKINLAIGIVANENRYHPIRELLESLVWDGIPRVADALPRFLGADRNEYTKAAFQHFMLGAVERLYHPGCKFDCLLCLVGGQGAGKSSFFRFLAISDDWFSDDLKRLGDDRSYSYMQGHWIIELAELSALKNTKTNEAVKAFLSRQKDTYRTPYDRYPRDRKRQCVFGGTTNEKQFLPLDRTGNRRFYPVEVHPEKAEVHILADEAASRKYFLQLWAEIMEIRRAGPVSLKLSDEIEAMAASYREEFSQEDTDAGLIYDFLENTSCTAVCTRLLFKEALGRALDEPKPFELRAISEIVSTGIATGRITGWKAYKDSRRFPIYGTQRGWERTGTGSPSLPLPEQFDPVIRDEDLPFQ